MVGAEGAGCRLYSYLSVQPPDESAGIVNHSVYTNMAARELLSWAAGMGSELHPELAESTYQHWAEVADRMFVPLSPSLCPAEVCGGDGSVHAEYEGYAGQAINQADAVLLQFPLQVPMPDQLAFNDLQYYASRTSVPGQSSRDFYTGDSSYSIAYLALLRRGFRDEHTGMDLRSLADEQFRVAFAHMDQAGYNVWKETSTGGHFNFLTGAGGFLQNVIYGYAGVSIDGGALSLDPLLVPGGVSRMKLRGLRYRRSVLDVEWDELSLSITLVKGEGRVVVQAAGELTARVSPQ